MQPAFVGSLLGFAADSGRVAVPHPLHAVGTLQAGLAIGAGKP
jgi:hypothetical protein